MVLVNYTTRELTAKLVFYGPGLCGKTTNLQYIFENLLPPDRKGKMVSLNTETDRTLFFDFLPLEIGTIRGLKTRLQLYTVPGQVHYNATRKIVLKGADGIVFVADSQETKREGNIESYNNMKQNLAEHGLDLRNVPFVLQFNKRDLPEVMSIDQMAADLNEYNVPFWEATAIEGIGVEDTLKGLVRLVMKNLAGRFQSDAAPAPGAQVSAAPAPAPALAAEPPAAAAPLPAAALSPAAAAPLQPEAPAAPSLPPVHPPAFVPVAPAPMAPVPSEFQFHPTPPAPAAPALPGEPPPAAPQDPFAPAASAPPPAPVAPSFWETPAPPGPAAAAHGRPGTLELELELDGSNDVLDVGEDQMVLDDPGPGQQPLDVGSAFDAALASGDTIIAPDFGGAPAPPAFDPVPAPAPMPADLEAALLSGDTMMSMDPMPGLLTEMPTSPAAPAATPPAQTPPTALAPPAALPLAAPEPAPFAMPSLAEQPLDAGGDLESSLLGGSMESDGGFDLETALMAGPRTSPSAPAPLQAPAPTRAPAPTPAPPQAVPPAAAPTWEAPLPLAEPEPEPVAPEPPGIIEVEAPIQLGRVATGEMVRRLVRVPIEFEDASGRRRTTLTVRLEFRVD